MRIKVLLFASLAETAGTVSDTIEIDPGATVSAVWEIMKERRPSLAGIKFKPLVACDMVYAEWDAMVADGSEIAFMPPVSGG